MQKAQKDHFLELQPLYPHLDASIPLDDPFPTNSRVQVEYGGGFEGKKWWPGTVVHSRVTPPTENGRPSIRVITVVYDDPRYKGQPYSVPLGTGKFRVRFFRDRESRSRETRPLPKRR